MTLFSHPLFCISQDEEKILSHKGFQRDSMDGRLRIDLKENTYAVPGAQANSGGQPDPGKEVIDIHFLKKVFKPPVVLSGFLDDSGLARVALLLNTAKKTFPPVNLLAGQLRDLLLHLGRPQPKRAASMHYREAAAVIRWAEALGAGRETADPDLPAGRRNQICGLLYGSRFSEIRRQRRMAFAYRQVLGTDESLLSIALQTGYGNRSYFITAFKKKFALTPGALRAHYRPPVATAGDKRPA